MPDVEVVEEKCMNSEKSFRGHTDLNHGPIGLQPIALPLSYIPSCDSEANKCETVKRDVLMCTLQVHSHCLLFYTRNNSGAAVTRVS